METFDLIVARDRRIWSIYSYALPGQEYQARRIADIESVARQGIASALGVDLDSLSVRVNQIHVPRFGDVAGEVRELEQLRASAVELESRSAARTAEFTKKLTSVDIPVRDIAELLGYSPQRVSQISSTEPVETIDPTLWARRARWAMHAALDNDELMAVMGLSMQQIGRLVATGNSTVADDPNGVLAPNSEFEDGPQWPAVPTLRFVLTQLPHRAPQVPRLFPRIPDPGPALFVRSQRLTVEEVGTFAVHVWRPGDGGPLVAVAYADRNVRRLDWPDHAAAALLDQLEQEVAAVALHNNEATSVRVLKKSGVGFELTEADQPCLMVADRTALYRPDPLGPLGARNVSRYWWTDLVNLLRVNLPWWPHNLRELGAMLAWRPWTPVQMIVPAAPTVDPHAITGLASIADPAPVRGALELQAALCLHRLASSATPDHYDVSPGLMFAAISAIDHRVAAPQLGINDKQAILHHRTTFERYDAMNQTTTQWDFMPVLTYGIRLNPDASGPLAQQWIKRLVEVPEDRYDEVGFWKLRSYVGDPTPIRWMTDPQAPDSWVLQAPDGTLCASVGTYTPNAIGKLTNIEIDNDAIFFTDSAGVVWPLPDTGFTYHRIGYDGSGPVRLTETIAQLLYDARADVHDATNLKAPIGLHNYLVAAQAPCTVPSELLLLPDD